ncbi:MAG: hypothetical protein R3E08_01650 [Thiotrichaceae bacterium]
MVRKAFPQKVVIAEVGFGQVQDIVSGKSVASQVSQAQFIRTFLMLLRRKSSIISSWKRI